MGSDRIDRMLFQEARELVTERALAGALRRARAAGDRLLLCGIESLQAHFPELVRTAALAADGILLDAEHVLEVGTDTATAAMPWLRREGTLVVAHLGWGIAAFEDSPSCAAIRAGLGHDDFVLTEPINELTAPFLDRRCGELIDPWRKSTRDASKKISIVILTALDNAPVFREMLRSFVRQTPPSDDIEVLVVVNGSRDESARFAIEELDDRYDLTLVRLPENVGIAGGFNEAVARARGDYVVLLQDDVVLKRRDWHRELAFYLDRHERIGVISGHQAGFYWRRPDARPWEAPLISRILRGRPCMRDNLVKVDSASCMLVMYRREIGLYDEDFIPNGVEDVAFSLRARQLGWEIWAVDSDVEHDVGYGSGVRAVTRRAYADCDFVHRLSRVHHYRRFIETVGDQLRPLAAGESPPSVDEIERTLETLPRDFRGEPLRRRPELVGSSQSPDV